MHELTRLSLEWRIKTYEFSNKRWEEEVLLPYITKQAEWLKKKLYPKNGCILVSNKSIDIAFGLSKMEPTLEEKIDKMMRSLCQPSTAMIIRECREHFKENPEELNNV